MTASYSPIRCLELLSRYAYQPSIALRNELAKMNTGLVRRVAHQLSRQCMEPYEDLEQVGFLGLIRAIERFDPKQGTAFSSFAIPYIRGEMLHYLRDKSSVLRVPRRWQELYSKGKSVSKQLTRQLGRSPTAREVASALNISIAEWQECTGIFQQRFVVSLDTAIANHEHHSLTFLETLTDERLVIKQLQSEEAMALQGAIRQLEPKTQAAIRSVYLERLPRKEVAKAIGISPMTVTRRIQKGLKELEVLLQDAAA
ncbi:MAG: hypothetical protein RLZZ490_1230 [Cyanobacteriota bacterium]|jgi:RNA polymerase sigma-B factor